MGDEHLDIIPETKLDEFIKSSVENLVPNPSESEGEHECDVPACDDFTTFSNLLFDVDDDFSSSDDESFFDEDISEKIYSNTLFDEEIISIKIDPHHFNAESDLIESLLNQDSSIISTSLKIDSLLDEFVGELILLKSIPSGIDKVDCDHEEKICLIDKLLKTVKDQDTCSQNSKVDKSDWTGLKSKRQGLGYGYTRKACFVCGSFCHLIKDCDFHEKRMAKQVELNKSKNKVSCQRNDRPVWNNVQRMNHKNKFVQTAILPKTGGFSVNATRQNFFSQAASTSTVRKVTTGRQMDNPYHTLKGKGFVDSGCSRHMTGNKAYLVEYQDFNGGSVAFGGSKGQITGIKREYSNARTPQQNGVAERKNRILIEAARTMLAYSFLPNTFWAKVVSTACYVHNRVLVTKPQNKTPYELLTGKGPTWLFDLNYLTDSMNYQLVTLENKANKTAAFADANHAGCQDTYCSTSGSVQFLRERLIS
nr:ribonuclease H-like domain-containing protein [Tanacetum cinerariifolium]